MPENDIWTRLGIVSKALCDHYPVGAVERAQTHTLTEAAAAGRALEVRVVDLAEALRKVLSCFSENGQHIAPVQGGNESQRKDVIEARNALAQWENRHGE